MVAEAASAGRDFPLGLAGFRYSDLHDARRLADLARLFDRFLESADAGLYARFDAWRRKTDSPGPVERSNLLIAVARHLGGFIARLFDIEELQTRAQEETRAQEPVFVFKREFLQRRAL